MVLLDIIACSVWHFHQLSGSLVVHLHSRFNHGQCFGDEFEVTTASWKMRPSSLLFAITEHPNDTVVPAYIRTYNAVALTGNCQPIYCYMLTVDDSPFTARYRLKDKIIASFRLTPPFLCTAPYVHVVDCGYIIILTESVPARQCQVRHASPSLFGQEEPQAVRACTLMLAGSRSQCAVLNRLKRDSKSSLMEHPPEYSEL